MWGNIYKLLLEEVLVDDYMNSKQRVGCGIGPCTVERVDPSASRTAPAENRWTAMASSSERAKRIVGLTMVDWTAGIGPNKRKIDDHRKLNTSVIEEIRDATGEEIKEAIKEFEQEKCILGLVAIAGVRNNEERELAVRVIGRIAKPDAYLCEFDIPTKCKMPWDPPKLPSRIETRSGLVEFTYMYQMVDLIPRIAVEIGSAALAKKVFGGYLEQNGENEISRKLLRLLIESELWYEIQSVCNSNRVVRNTQIPIFSDSFVIALTPYIEQLEKARTWNLLEKIAEIHPDSETRRRVADIFANPETIRWSGLRISGVCHYLSVIAERTEFVDTAKHAIDLIVKIVRETDEVTDIGLGGVVSRRTTKKVGTGEEVDPIAREIVLYALEKTIKLWDLGKGYGYVHQWKECSKEIKEKITEYFKRNLDKVVKSRGWVILEFLVVDKSIDRSLAAMAFSALEQLVTEIPKDRETLLDLVIKNTKDGEVRELGEMRLLELKTQDKKAGTG